MKALKDHLILFDEECPVCLWAASSATASGMLEQQGKVSYQNADYAACPMVDRKRAANEMALVNLQTGEVIYGIKGLFKILGNAYPALKPLFTFTPLVWLLGKLYKLFAFNRRVIVPVMPTQASTQPAFSLTYRIVYLAIATGLASLVSSRYTLLINTAIPFGIYFLMPMGALIIMGSIVSIIKAGTGWNYLGNIATLYGAGALLLLPVLITAPLIGHHPGFYIAYLVFVATLMILEHIRRGKLLALPPAVTIGFILYHLLVFASLKALLTQ